MTGTELLVSRCSSCTHRYLPRVGPCPKCGASSAVPLAIPARGTVLAATELVNPAAGWTAPHRLALLEMAESVRVLAVVEGNLSTTGSVVPIVRDGETYRVPATTS